MQARRKIAALGTAFPICCYALARTLEVAHTAIPNTPIVALDVISAMAFALVDGARRYRRSGILIFAAICLLVGNAIENLGLTTGFPFGHYRFLELMGPKLFRVPLLLGLAYVGMAYVAWSLARIIVGSRLGGARGVLLLPTAAAFIMVAWDLAQDPVWSTLLHGWVWLDGGGWFGVPVSNYFGWFVTVWLIFLLFSLYLRSRPDPPIAVSRTEEWPPILFYALCAAANVAQAFALPPGATVMHDAAGHPWRARDITVASALVSVFVMGGFALIAAIRLSDSAHAAAPSQRPAIPTN